MCAPMPLMHSMKVLYLCSPGWRTAPRYCVPPLQHAMNHKMLASHALMHNKLIGMVAQICLEHCQRTRCAHFCVQSFWGGRLTTQRRKTRKNVVRPKVMEFQIFGNRANPENEPFVMATAPNCK